MNQFVRWLGTKLYRSQDRSLVDAPSASESPDTSENDHSLNLPKELQDLVDDASIPAAQEDTYDTTVPDIALEDQVSSAAGDAPGFDPYDTVELHKK